MASFATAGKTITCRAAVVWSRGAEFAVENIHVAPPQAGEVRVKIFYSSLCHTDLKFWKEPGPFPLPFILGHEGSGVVESIGEGVDEVQVGDHVISLPQAECKKCKLCKVAKTNMCLLILRDKKGVMPGDEKTRFFALDGTPIHHFWNCSTFTEYTVLHESSVVKISSPLPMDRSCLLSCGVTTGLGSAWNIAKVEPGSTVAVIGLGTVGLAIIEGAKIAGASRIIGIDIQPSKFEIAKALGATECLDPKASDRPIQQVIHDLTDGGVDYSFECVGHTQPILDALECCNEYGTSVTLGYCSDNDTVTFPPRLLFFGRQWKSGCFGGFKGRSQMQGLVDKCMSKEISLDQYITHRLPFSRINHGIELLAKGSSCVVKCVFHMDDAVGNCESQYLEAHSTVKC